jgi:hypothetical protein
LLLLKHEPLSRRRQLYGAQLEKSETSMASRDCGNIKCPNFPPNCDFNNL